MSSNSHRLQRTAMMAALGLEYQHLMPNLYQPAREKSQPTELDHQRLAAAEDKRLRRAARNQRLG